MAKKVTTKPSTQKEIQTDKTKQNGAKNNTRKYANNDNRQATQTGVKTRTIG